MPDATNRRIGRNRSIGRTRSVGRTPFAALEGARKTLFGDHKPADTVLGVASLSPDYLIEVDAIAVIDGLDQTCHSRARTLRCISPIHPRERGSLSRS